MRKPKCPHCGFQALKLQSEEMAISIVRGNPQDSAEFLWRVSDPRIVLGWPIGHHSTLLESQLKKMFPKDTRKILLARLPADERKAFKKTLEGKLFV